MIYNFFREGKEKQGPTTSSTIFKKKKKSYTNNEKITLFIIIFIPFLIKTLLK